MANIKNLEVDRILFKLSDAFDELYSLCERIKLFHLHSATMTNIQVENILKIVNSRRRYFDKVKLNLENKLEEHLQNYISEIIDFNREYEETFFGVHELGNRIAQIIREISVLSQEIDKLRSN